MKKYLKINSKLVSSVNDGLIATWNTEEIFPTPMEEQPTGELLTGLETDAVEQ